MCDFFFLFLYFFNEETVIASRMVAFHLGDRLVVGKSSVSFNIWYNNRLFVALLFTGRFPIVMESSLMEN